MHSSHAFFLFHFTEMVRNYQRKTDRGTFTKEIMRAAVQTVLSGTSVRKAAQEFDLSYKTLGRYVKLQENERHHRQCKFRLPNRKEKGAKL